VAVVRQTKQISLTSVLALLTALLGCASAEMNKVIPDVRPGDQIVIFCPDTNRTLVYLNDSSTGDVHDPSFCPAIMSVWLHPQTKHQAMRKSLLRQ
jgi:hypothetical protein